jgi:hypothetical protein
MNRTPVVLAIVLLLLPMLYVGSYLALVVPSGIVIHPGYDPSKEPFYLGYRPMISPLVHHYRTANETAERIFWPLEQIDRRVRRAAWEGKLIPKGKPSPFVPERTDTGGALPENP